MKRFRKLIIPSLLLIAILFLASQKYEGPDSSSLEVQGSSYSEKLESVAMIASINAGEFAHVSFSEYDEEKNEWRFSIQIRHSLQDTMNPQGAYLREYAKLVGTIFVEASKVIKEEQGRIVSIAFFTDLDARIESTQRMSLIASDPEGWTSYMDPPDGVIIIPESDFKKIIQEITEEIRQEIREGS